MLDNGLSPVTTADAAKETAGIVAGIDAALLTLFFSISLLVLTLAAGNLGVRLIDRWLGKRLVQVSIAGLTFTTLFSVLTLAAIDSEADLAQTPLATITVMLALLAVNLAMLAVALHDLGRTMFIDKAIDSLGKDARIPWRPARRRSTLSAWNASPVNSRSFCPPRAAAMSKASIWMSWKNR
jgi:uncharacterized membrane protein